MDEKRLERFGVAGRNYGTKEEAFSDTYTTHTGEWVTTPFAGTDNPYSQEFLSAKNVLDIGCGCGRNLRWFMENTNAEYWGFDPNPTQLKYFWEMNDEKWKSRVHLSLGFPFDEMPQDGFDVVVSTFVFMHIGFRPAEDVMNVADITLKIMEYTKNGTVWFFFEHDGEEKWIEYWSYACSINLDPPTVYWRHYDGETFKCLTERNPLVPGGEGHHLIIFKEAK